MLVLTVDQPNVLELNTPTGSPVTVKPQPGGAVSAVTSFLWKPGSAPSSNVFQTWAQVQAAIDALGGVPYKLGLDNSGGALTIPAGAVRLGGNAVWTSANPAVFAAVTFSNGAIIDTSANTFWTIDACIVSSQGGASPMSTAVSGGIQFVRCTNQAVLRSLGASPFIDATSGNTAVLLLDGFSQLGDRVHNAVVGSGMSVICTGASLLTSNSLGAATGPGTPVVNYEASSETEVPGTPVTVPAGWTNLRRDLALQVIPTATTTVARPASPQLGQPVFDTTLGIPIWWNGTNWVNSVGAIV